MPPTKVKKQKVKKAVRHYSEGRLYINATFNNTIVTVTDPGGDVLSWVSAGSSGFKGTRKSTPYAATTTIERALEKARNDFGLSKYSVFIKGPGTGRDAALRALRANRNISILKISDITPIPHNGPRPPKQRRG
jgi:small subunit ribosomal protein S11